MKNWFLWLLAGILSLIGGLVGLANPLAATLTAELLAGWTFLVVGVLTLASAVGARDMGARIVAILLGILILLLGLSLINNPLAGVVSLTLLVALMLLLAGLFRLVLAFSVPGARLRWVLILAGALSLVLGVLILTNFPQSAAVVLGLFLSVELISNGVSLIVLSLSRKSDRPA